MSHSKKTIFRSALDYEGRTLAVCLEKIAEQNQLLRIVWTALPPSMAKHATHCVISGARLLIYTSSAAWASQIRFFQVAILNKLHECGQQKITHIQVKILFQPKGTEKGRSVRLPSAKTVQNLLGSVDQTSDDELDRSLTKLAATLKKRIES